MAVAWVGRAVEADSDALEQYRKRMMLGYK
jgi:hypothetical protein